MRWLTENTKERSEYVDTLDGFLQYELIPLGEKTAALKQNLLLCTKGLTSIEEDSFIKVPFQQVLDLVSRRAVYLNGGYAYVPKTEIYSLIITRFKSMLERKLEVSF